MSSWTWTPHAVWGCSSERWQWALAHLCMQLSAYAPPTRTEAFF